MKIRINIINLLNSKNNKEIIIFENNNFIIVEDKKHNDNSYHYCAWSKKDVRNLLEVDNEILNNIIEIKKFLLENKIINEEGYIFVHFPPSIWRLHIHFVEKNHVFLSPNNEIFYLSEITQNLINDKYYYLKNVTIRNKL